jgi:tyrosyl-tRNA synthetase
LKLNLMEFLRDVGKHFTVNYMTAKESVKTRFQDEEGISFTEFSYMLLQAYDFMHLYLHYGCKLQAGGSDQWGNITAGVELIRKSRGESVHGVVYPLITNPDGSKLGKTEKGTVWLDPERTSPYRFYQFWYNQVDASVIDFLKYFTWLDRNQIGELEEAVKNKPEERQAQRVLAREVTRMVHGETALQKAELASEVLFGREISGLSAGEVRDIFADVPSSDCAKSRFEGEGMQLTALLAETTLASSKGEARRLLQGGGMYVNNRRVIDPFATISMSDAVDGQFIVLRKGRKDYHLVHIR